MAKKTAVVRFLGTNCDRDIYKAVEDSGGKPEWWWYQDQFSTDGVDAIILPGGFSYGDYLRSGALAARSPVMKSVRAAAQKGIPVLGICNGFQILCEAELLPGALVKNVGQRFIDDWVELKPQNKNQFWAAKSSASIKLPIAHGDGRFYASEDTLKKIFDDGLVWWTYTQTPNGSLKDVAGVMNEGKNVCALMPHPERALFDWMGGVDGRDFFARCGV